MFTTSLIEDYVYTNEISLALIMINGFGDIGGHCLSKFAGCGKIGQTTGNHGGKTKETAEHASESKVAIIREVILRIIMFIVNTRDKRENGVDLF